MICNILCFLSFLWEVDLGNERLLFNLGLNNPGSQCKYLFLSSKSVVLICVLWRLSGSMKREEWTCGQATVSLDQNRSTFNVSFF